jgi:hypothetical protein
MFFQYGAFKPLAARKAGRIMTLRQLVPAAFVLGLLGSAAAALLWPPAIWITAAVAGAYAATVLACALRVAGSHGRRCAVALMAVFPVVHFSYGFGFLRGLWAGLSGRGGRWRDPAAVPLSR